VTSRQLGLLLVLGAAWGAVYPLTTIALRDFDTPTVVFGRALLAAAVLLPLALITGSLHELRRRPADLVVASLIQSTLPLVLLTLGQEDVSSSLAGILVASQPLFVALLAFGFDPADRPDGRGLLGVILGLIGVALLFGLDLRHEHATALAGLAVLGAGVSFAAGAVYIRRRLTDVSPLVVANASMTVSALALLPFAAASIPAALEDLGHPPTLLVMVGLGSACTGLALALYYALIHAIGTTRATLAGYLAPAYALIYGIPLGDPVTATKIIGLLLILAGSALAARKHGAPPRHGSPDNPASGTSATTTIRSRFTTRVTNR